MTQKAEFNAEEWSLILEAAPTAAMIIVTSNKGGSIRESLSVGKSYKAEAQNPDQTELLAAIVADRPALDAKRYSDPSELATAGLQRVRGAVDTVEAKGTAPEVEDFKRFIYDVARNTAEAHKEGGFLGIGGTKISEAEAEALGRLAETIGYSAPPLEPTEQG
jgi:hypothetical protein